MKAEITSTNQIVDISDSSGRCAAARVWEGVTEGGVPFVAYITCVQVRKREDNSQFESELMEHKFPEAETSRAIDLRFVI